MKTLFSPKRLWTAGMIALSLLIVYLLFLIFPFLIPFWIVASKIAVPFLIAMIIAYLLHPLVDLFMKTGINRLLSILLIYILFFGGIGLVVWFGTPIFLQQVRDVSDELPKLQQTLSSWINFLNDHIERLPDGIHYGIDDAINRLEVDSRDSIGKAVEGMGVVIDRLFAFITIPFLVFYFLHDVEIMQKTLLLFIPSSKRKMVLKLWKDIDHSLGEYIRGQILVSVVVGVLAFIGYTLIGLPYSLFLATIVATTNIIPYFGPFIGAAPAVLVGLITNPTLVIWIILINLAIQIIEGNILGPWIVGKRLHIHPVLIILALLIGNELGGILGLILAVPLFVILKVILANTVQHIRLYRKQVVQGD